MEPITSGLASVETVSVAPNEIHRTSKRGLSLSPVTTKATMALFRRDRNGSIREHGLRGRTSTSLEKQEVRSLTHDIDDTLDRDFKVMDEI